MVDNALLCSWSVICNGLFMYTLDLCGPLVRFMASGKGLRWRRDQIKFIFNEEFDINLKSNPGPLGWDVVRTICKRPSALWQNLTGLNQDYSMSFLISPYLCQYLALKGNYIAWSESRFTCYSHCFAMCCSLWREMSTHNGRRRGMRGTCSGTCDH